MLTLLQGTTLATCRAHTCDTTLFSAAHKAPCLVANAHVEREIIRSGIVAPTCLATVEERHAYIGNVIQVCLSRSPRSWVFPRNTFIARGDCVVSAVTLFQIFAYIPLQKIPNETAEI